MCVRICSTTIDVVSYVACCTMSCRCVVWCCVTCVALPCLVLSLCCLALRCLALYNIVWRGDGIVLYHIVVLQYLVLPCLAWTCLVMCVGYDSVVSHCDAFLLIACYRCVSSCITLCCIASHWAVLCRTVQVCVVSHHTSLYRILSRNLVALCCVESCYVVL